MAQDSFLVTPAQAVADFCRSAGLTFQRLEDMDDFDPGDYGDPDISQEQAEWRERWPNHCPICHGWGVVGRYIPPTRTDPGDYPDPCDCVYGEYDGEHPDNITGAMVPLCPRCQNAGLADGADGPCRNCGWNYDDGMPMYSW